MRAADVARHLEMVDRITLDDGGSTTMATEVSHQLPSECRTSPLADVIQIDEYQDRRSA